MNLPAQVAKHFRDLHYSGNSTSVNLKDTLAGVAWQQATAKIQSFDAIAVQVFYTNDYVLAVSRRVQGEPRTAKNKYSFGLRPVNSEEDWQTLLDQF